MSKTIHTSAAAVVFCVAVNCADLSFTDISQSNSDALAWQASHESAAKFADHRSVREPADEVGFYVQAEGISAEAVTGMVRKSNFLSAAAMGGGMISFAVMILTAGISFIPQWENIAKDFSLISALGASGLTFLAASLAQERRI